MKMIVLVLDMNYNKCIAAEMVSQAPKRSLSGSAHVDRHFSPLDLPFSHDWLRIVIYAKSYITWPHVLCFSLLSW
jgi:hypothetical protein